MLGEILRALALTLIAVLVVGGVIYQQSWHRTRRQIRRLRERPAEERHPQEVR